jgi:hypothetical protein
MSTPPGPVHTVVVDDRIAFADLLLEVRRNAGLPVVLVIPDASPYFLTASEFRALRETIRQYGIALTVQTGDAHRAEFAHLFNLPVVGDPRPRRMSSHDPLAPHPAPQPAGPADTWPARPRRPLDGGDQGGPPQGRPDLVPRRNGGKIVAIVVVALILVGVLGALFMPSATVVLVRQRQDLQGQITYRVATDGQPAGPELVVPGQVVSLQVTVEGVAPATGEQREPDHPATGEVVFANPTANPVTFAAGSVVTSADGVRARVITDVTVPAAGDAAGSASARVSTVDGGEALNLARGAFSGVTGEGVYFSNRTGAFSEGTDRITRFVVDADIAAAVADAETRVAEATAAAVATQYGGVWEIVPASVQHAPVAGAPNAAAGTIVDEVRASAVVAVQVTVYDASAVRTLAVSALQGQAAAGTFVDPASLTLGPIVAGADGVLTRTIGAGATIAVDPAVIESLPGAISGGSLAAAEAQVRALPGVVAEGTRIELSPGWWPARMPLLAGRITVVEQ